MLRWLVPRLLRLLLLLLRPRLRQHPMLLLCLLLLWLFLLLRAICRRLPAGGAAAGEAGVALQPEL